LSREIAAEHGKESDPGFLLSLENKIIWCRYVKDEESLRQAFTC